MELTQQYVLMVFYTFTTLEACMYAKEVIGTENTCVEFLNDAWFYISNNLPTVPRPDNISEIAEGINDNKN
tara:strand:+ start:280 stop:492 length:213 start_codon:yes stop_codon:yes gene_type:complete